MLTPTTAYDLFDRGHLEDPYPFYEALRTTAPVHRVPETRFHLVSTWDLVQEVASRTEDFSSHLVAVMVERRGNAPMEFPMDRGGSVEQVLATADDPEHKAHRTLVMRTLGKRIRALEDEVGRVADSLWAEHCTGTEVDWVSTMADRLPLALVATLVGLPQSDVPQLLRWAYDSTELFGGVVADGRVDSLVASMLELHEYLAEKFALALREPRDDLLGVLAEACRAGKMEESTAVMVLVQILGAGGESTAGLVASAARILATRPDLQTRLRAEPELLDVFLDECLRLESPFRGHYRNVVGDTELGGISLPAGSHLLLLWGAANRDPSRFDRPAEVDLDRPGVRQHLAFGKGTHFCAGSALARMEALAATRLLLEGTDGFELAGPDAARWVPSIFVRRHETLRLRLHRTDS